VKTIENLSIEESRIEGRVSGSLQCMLVCGWTACGAQIHSGFMFFRLTAL